MRAIDINPIVIARDVEPTFRGHLPCRGLRAAPLVYLRPVGLPAVLSLYSLRVSVNQTAIRNFNGKPESKAKKMANSFNSQYSSVVKHKSSKSARTTTKKLKRIVDTSLLSHLQTPPKQSRAPKLPRPWALTSSPHCT